MSVMAGFFFSLEFHTLYVYHTQFLSHLLSDHSPPPFLPSFYASVSFSSFSPSSYLVQFVLPRSSSHWTVDNWLSSYKPRTSCSSARCQTLSPFPSVWDLSSLSLQRSWSCYHHLCEFVCICTLVCLGNTFTEVICGFWLFLLPLPWWFLSLERKGVSLVEQSDQLWVFVDCHLPQEASLMKI